MYVQCSATVFAVSISDTKKYIKKTRFVLKMAVTLSIIITLLVVTTILDSVAARNDNW